MRGIFWLLLVALGCAAAVFLVLGPTDDPDDQQAATDAIQTDPPPPPPVEPVAVPTPVIPPPVVEAPEPLPALLVDSFPPDAQPRMDDWPRVSDPGGHLDVVVLKGSGSPVTEGNALRADEIIVAQGWAGDADLGIRYLDVLFSMCGRFIGRAQIDRERPDVANAVHPNLLKSGWVAELYAGDLPICANPELIAWAVVPGRQAALAALVGKRRIEVEPPVGALADRVSSQVMVNPFDYWPYERVGISVTASRANMRRCGSTDCAVVAQVDRGRYPVAVLERRDGWTLLAFEDRVGWLFDELFETGP
ncbi:MAG: SH3 domain-containing protein [Alphaproteobacteria bacterium]|nr:SH3 domain-containing protein [Alphaproteobacteria bacterium]